MLIGNTASARSPVTAQAVADSEAAGRLVDAVISLSDVVVIVAGVACTLLVAFGLFMYAGGRDDKKRRATGRRIIWSSVAGAVVVGVVRGGLEALRNGTLDTLMTR